MRALHFLAAASALAMLALPGVVQAHRQWMLPSSTIVSGDDVWVTVDAAVSNDLFYFEHQPMRLDNVKAWAPDGSEAQIENKATGRYRSVFDLHLTQRGTYKIASAMSGIGGSFKVNGQEQRLPRGTAAAQIATTIPAGATDVKITETANRNEIFVTSGEPSQTVLRPTGQGLEFVPETHPNDLVAGEPSIFKFTIDGRPAANITVTVIPGGIRYRDQLNEQTLHTDAQGKLSITWPDAGVYWLNAVATDTRTSVPQATERRMSYITTLEVQAP